MGLLSKHSDSNINNNKTQFTSDDLSSEINEYTSKNINTLTNISKFKKRILEIMKYIASPRKKIDESIENNYDSRIAGNTWLSSTGGINFTNNYFAQEYNETRDSEKFYRDNHMSIDKSVSGANNKQNEIYRDPLCRIFDLETLFIKTKW